MYSRHSTPPATSYNYIPGSVGSDVTYYSQESSPAPNVAPTPPRSPVRQLGPTLLPKVRTQDQVAEPTAGPIRHRRTTSAASTVSYGYSPYSRPVSQSYRESSPYTHNNMISPVSNGSCDFNGLSMLNSPITFTPSEGRRASSYAPTHSRSSSVNASRHARSTSTNSIDESMISRYGFPTYRNIPNYVTAPSAPQSTFVTSPVEYSQLQQPPSYTAQALDFPLLDFEPAPAVQYPSFTEQPSLQPSLQPSFDAYQPVATSSLLEYLSGPNPSPALVRRVTAAPRGIHNHFWWDVRNLRSWEDFNIAAIKEIPSILPLLEVPVSQSYLPQPSRQNMQPEHEAALHDICTNYYANKVNAALKIAQGTSHMQMRAIKPAPGARDQPQFVSSYPSDFEKTLFGDVRGRVVGLVKCYDNWNTGMRSESAPKQVLYLQGLAHLQRVMREHGCRYGFIMTEIELLCVRAGGDSSTPDPTTFNAAAGMPIFGYLELSAPISLATSGASASGDVQLTASLALWYLHMLAKENPFEGMGTWRMEVGGPAALSRQNHLEKDAWIPKPQLGEKREAKRVRGWVFPEEPLSKRECGKGRRGKSVG